MARDKRTRRSAVQGWTPGMWLLQARLPITVPVIMFPDAIRNPRTQRSKGIRGLRFTAAIMAAAVTTGCTQVPVWRQGLVSKPNMVFNDRGAFVYGMHLNSQIEPGSADNGGATAAGCTACK